MGAAPERRGGKEERPCGGVKERLRGEGKGGRYLRGPSKMWEGERPC